MLGILALVALPRASAQALYWDANGTVSSGAGATPTGTWSTGGGSASNRWNTSSTGSGGTISKWIPNRDAVFSAGTNAVNSYTVTVSGTQNVSGITIEEGTPTFTGGTINFSGSTPDLVINSSRTLNWGSTGLTSDTDTLNISGGGTLNFTADKTFAGTVNLGGGTLRLAAADLTFGTLNVTGNSIINFAGTASSLNLTNLVIGAGVTLTIQGWQNAVDYLYTQNFSGATLDSRGTGSAGQVVFSGFSGSSTIWQSYDRQVTPVPEPAAYGAALLGALAAFFAWRRRRISAVRS